MAALGTMMIYIYVGLFGLLGSVARYELGIAGQHFFVMGSFPIGTFICNLLGCFLLSAFYAWTDRVRAFPAYLRTGFGTGFVGSFTTFSTFSVETVLLMKNQLWVMAFCYVALSIAGGLLMSWLGFRIIAPAGDS